MSVIGPIVILLKVFLSFGLISPSSPFLCFITVCDYVGLNVFSADYVSFPLEPLGHCGIFENGVLLMYMLESVSSGANFIIAYEKSQLNRGSHFLICSVFFVSKGNHFDVYWNEVSLAGQRTLHRQNTHLKLAALLVHRARLRARKTNFKFHPSPSLPFSVLSAFADHSKAGLLL